MTDPTPMTPEERAALRDLLERLLNASEEYYEEPIPGVPGVMARTCEADQLMDKFAGFCSPENLASLLASAEEVERLRADNVKLYQRWSDLTGQYTDLEEREGRLREALRMLATGCWFAKQDRERRTCPVVYPNGPNTDEWCVSCIASHALAEPVGDDPAPNFDPDEHAAAEDIRMRRAAEGDPVPGGDAP